MKTLIIKTDSNVDVNKLHIKRSQETIDSTCSNLMINPKICVNFFLLESFTVAANI